MIIVIIWAYYVVYSKLILQPPGILSVSERCRSVGIHGPCVLQYTEMGFAGPRFSKYLKYA